MSIYFLFLYSFIIFLIFNYYIFIWQYNFIIITVLLIILLVLIFFNFIFNKNIDKKKFFTISIVFTIILSLFIINFTFLFIKKYNYEFLNENIYNENIYSFLIEENNYINCIDDELCNINEIFNKDILELNKSLNSDINLEIHGNIYRNLYVLDKLKNEYKINDIELKIDFNKEEYLQKYLNHSKIVTIEYVNNLNNWLFFNQNQFIKYLDSYYYWFYDIILNNENLDLYLKSYESDILIYDRKKLYNLLLSWDYSKKLYDFNNFIELINKINYIELEK